jgi:hypothetical protein
MNGLRIIEALAPEVSRFSVATGVDPGHQLSQKARLWKTLNSPTFQMGLMESPALRLTLEESLALGVWERLFNPKVPHRPV